MTEEVLFHAILSRPEAERAAYLAEHCPDPGLRRQVESLLAAHGGDGGPLDCPAATGAFAPERVSDASAEPAESPGVSIGPYKLLQLIGEGGMGAVWMAEQEKPVRRRVALKVIKPGMDSAQVIARFEAERQALALMDHVNIAKVLDADTTPTGRPYFVMELIRGEPITKFCDDQHLTPRERMELFVPVCQAVQHAHQKGVIHRDLKPSNVLVTLYDGRPVPKVIDFGVAKAIQQRLTERTMFTEFGAVVGTFEYMAPEQAALSHLDVDTRSDVYSLGVLLYELLTGTTPLERHRLRSAAFDEVLRLIREEEPPKPSTRLSASGDRLPSVAAARRMEPAKLSRLVRGELDWIVMKALEKDRARRYETANGLARDLQRYLADEPVEACPPTAGYRLRKFARKHLRAVVTAGTVVAMLIVGVVVSAWLAVRATTAEAIASAAREAESEQRQAAEAQRDRALTAEANAKAAEKRAQDEQAVARAINSFLLFDLLDQSQPSWQAAAGSRLDPDIKMRTLLDRASAKVGERFKNQPRVEAEVRMVIGQVYHGLGMAATGQQKRELLASVEGHFLRALELCRKEYGDDHLRTQVKYNRLGNMYRAAGQFEKAEWYYRRDLEASGKTFGPEHRETLAPMKQLADLFRDMGRATEAEATYREALGAYQRVLGDADLNTIDAKWNLGVLYLHQGRLDEAQPLLEQALAGRGRLYRDKRRARPAGYLSSLGRLHTLQGRLAEGEDLFREALDSQRGFYGEEHPATANSQEELADNLSRQRRWAEAEPLARRCLAVREKDVPGTWEVSAAQGLLGAILVGQQRFADAEPLLVAAYDGLQARAAAIPALRRLYHLVTAVERLIHLYEAWGKPEQAAKWRAERAASGPVPTPSKPAKK